jgi:hypothetical protein
MTTRRSLQLLMYPICTHMNGYQTSLESFHCSVYVFNAQISLCTYKRTGPWERGGGGCGSNQKGPMMDLYVEKGHEYAGLD